MYEAVATRDSSFAAAQDLQSQLEKILEALRWIGIPWDEAMLSWPKGPKPEDGIWAKHWYTRLHRTTASVRCQTSCSALRIRSGVIGSSNTRAPIPS